MTMWLAVLLACAGCFALKFAGYLVPARWVEGPRLTRVTTLLPVALLAALLVVQTVAGGDALTIDARLAALAVAIVLLLLRVNFVLVVLAAALVAAGLRALGWG